jgi:urease accessory protein
MSAVTMATSTEGRLALRVERRSGRSVVTRSSGHVPLAAREVGDGRVVLVQTAAGPLAGDRIVLDVEVGPGATLELRATAATLAYPAAHEAVAATRFHLERGARLAWLAEPLILAAGCDLAATVEIELDEGAAALVRETVVLGRHGETAGRYRSSMRCDLAGTPLLRESIRLDGASAVTASPLVLGGARAYSTLALLGRRPGSEPTAGELDLAGPGRVLRVIGPDAAAGTARAESAYVAALHAT